VVICDSYELPVLTVGGNYYTAINGGGTMLPAGSIINTTQTLYVYAASGNGLCFSENSFDITINITPIVPVLDDVTVCDSFILPVLTVGNYYTDANGSGTLLASGTAITSTQTIYIYQETATVPNCFDASSFTVTIFETPQIDDPSDVVVCDSYVLPVLTIGGNYYTATNGGGSVLAAGSIINTTQTLYVYAASGNGLCFSENSFEVTINITPVVPILDDITVCDSYTLPVLANGNYYTGANGSGTLLAAGTAITSTQTIYIYQETATVPNCFDESSFEVIINDTPVVDSPQDEFVCVSYTLPALTLGGDYYTAPDGGGTMLSAGTVLTSTQTLYVYAETSTVPNCFSQAVFTVNIFNEPLINTPTAITVCDDNNDGFAVFNLNQSLNQITGGQPFVVTFHLTEAASLAGVNAITTPQAYTNININTQTFQGKGDLHFF
jgi:hypothetical protein